MTQGPDFTNPGQIAQRTVTYDTDNMPVQITEGSTTVSFTYDGDIKRVKKSAGSSTVYYVGDHYEVKNNESLKYLFAGNLRLSMIKGNNTYYFHKDHLGSSTLVTNNNGGIEETTQYEPFGATRGHTGQDLSGYKFTDQEQDVETNLYNYDARLYDPVIGRFGTADNIIQNWYDPQSLNAYAYCRNNPLIYTDPTGHYDEGGGGQNWQTSMYLSQSEITPTGKALWFGVTYFGSLIGAPLGAAAGLGLQVGEVCEGKMTAGQLAGNIGYGLLTAPKTIAEDLFSGDPVRMGQGTAGVIGFAALGKAALSKMGSVENALVSEGAGGWTKLIGQLEEASKGKGNFGIGSGTRAEAAEMGRAWVGEGYEVASDGKTLLSKNKMRQYRPPSYKKELGKVQANFEQKIDGQKSKQWQSNAHLDIED